MTKRDQMIECMSAIEDGMSRTAQHRDIWQNELIYWLCKAVYLLLDKAVKDRKDEFGEKKVLTDETCICQLCAEQAQLLP